VPAEVTNVVAVAVGGGFTLALESDGTVVAWGSYYSSSGYVPMTVPTGLTNVLAISAGINHCLALVGGNPPVQQVAPTELDYSDNQLSITVPTQSGRVYRLEQSTSLSDTNWSPMPLSPGNGAEQTFTDASATNAMGFYRIRQW
jgi:hypothetical protein